MVTKIKWIKTIVISICFGVAGIATADIEEIIVTALKRETTLQDTPLSVSVISSETIEQSAIVDLLDLANSVPSFKFTQLQQPGQTNFWIPYQRNLHIVMTPPEKTFSLFSIIYEGSKLLDNIFETPFFTQTVLSL